MSCIVLQPTSSYHQLTNTTAHSLLPYKHTFLHISVVTPYLCMLTCPNPILSSNALYCTLGVQCPVTIPPLDGDVSWSSNEVGAVLHYYCREGFDLVGTASQECLPTGEWSSYTPLCTKGESVGGGACEETRM